MGKEQVESGTVASKTKMTAKNSASENSAGNTGTEQSFRIPDLLKLKASGAELSQAQIQYLITSVVDGNMDDAQLGALLMAIMTRGMNKQETITLTDAMMKSGEVLQWPREWVVGDKHSTGGVGDKVSLALSPALAACGLKVPMISGRGLEHTGGSLDKLESIPGFRVSLSEEELEEALASAGCVVAGQTAALVPADRRMYATRDVTGTVASLPLVVSSILSKKAAESLGSLVLDVKYGHGAFMKTPGQAEELARAMVDTMNSMGVVTTALITVNDNPIGRTIGNALEVEEAIECLCGRGPSDMRELVIKLGSELLHNAKLVPTLEDGERRVSDVLDNGKGRSVFCRMLQMQGVSAGVAKALCSDPPDFSALPKAPHVTQLMAPSGGVIVEQDALVLAKVSLGLGAGRSRAGEPINYAVGIRLLKIVGDTISAGEPWVELHHSTSTLPTDLKMAAEGALSISAKTTDTKKATLVLKRIF